MANSNIIKTIGFSAIFVVLQPALARQSSPNQEPARWWMNLCLNHTGEFSVNVKKGLLWAARASYVGDPGVPGGTTGAGPPSWDAGVLVGQEWHNEWFSGSITGGAAMTVVRQDYTFGIPLEAHAVATPVSFIGLGIGLFGNLNPKGSFFQFGFTLRLGNL